MHVPWILLKFHSGIFRLFRIAKNRKFRENVVTARAAPIFTVYGKILFSCVCNSATDFLQFHKTVLMILGAQVHRMRNSIGLCCIYLFINYLFIYLFIYSHINLNYMKTLLMEFVIM